MKKAKRIGTAFIFVIAIAAILLIVKIFANFFTVDEPAADESPQIISESTLERIIRVSELSTFEMVYNGVARIRNEETGAIDYYVYYESTVRAGIDFDKVEININEEEQKVYVALPPVELNEPNVNIGTMEYIFVNNKANKSTVSEEAYKESKADAYRKCKDEEEIYEIARQNAENAIRALIEPFVEQVHEEYEIVISEGDYE